MNTIEKLNKILFDADLFCTNCAHNPGMEDEYLPVAAALSEENINNYEAFSASLDFWMWKGFTNSQPQAKATYQAIKIILEQQAH